MKNEPISVSQFQALINQTLEFAYGEVVVEGEVASYKVSQGKWVFFDLKDENSVVGCFMTIFQLKTVLEDGMLVRVTATPQLTKWGKFSLTVKTVELAGEGTVKRAFELLKAQFEREGLFAAERKRPLPEFPQKVALVTSRQAAAYNDFLTILNDRWGGVEVDHYQVLVQGTDAPDSIKSALESINHSKTSYDVVVLIRGGGSAEDLQVFNTEEVVRSVYGLTAPTLVGIGHEDDVTLAELAADVRAATPTDAARRLVPDRERVAQRIQALQSSQLAAMTFKLETTNRIIKRFEHAFGLKLQAVSHDLRQYRQRYNQSIGEKLLSAKELVKSHGRLLHSLNPETVLSRGYSITRSNGQVVTSSDQVRGESSLVIQLYQGEIKARLITPNNQKYDKSKKSQTAIEL